ncbi:winged helix-turn-helix transcriptional regulator [Spirosoma utsteinense]|uniref:DNA-binding HxlR family transcriptional regulator n=1 Tax=Spirosoma utsteinense TaxID=2585773 RepID=A0ABR6WFW2_9BACT|nr:helix-turn-helix domain-containing protein [Spirosoma utsteinense]MBC3788876.1 DNA-binding HxlR family transcriptional regulator [Spirosoma utsteinense]MBC3794817.1 DNA-binding HxlR family transcriptional regulator [Spirosoma utsteinense]
MANVKETSTNSVNRRFLTSCDMTYAVQLMGGRWKLLILMRLAGGKLRFGELRKFLPNITERMLTLQLREMEEDGLLIRTVYAEVPPRVDYALTPIAHDLVPICQHLHSWGASHRKAHVGQASPMAHTEAVPQ